MEPAELQNELVSAEGRNRKAVLCQRCGSRVLQPGTALFSRRQVGKYIDLIRFAVHSDRVARNWSGLPGFRRPRPSSRGLAPPTFARPRPSGAADLDPGGRARLPDRFAPFSPCEALAQRVHLSREAHPSPGLDLWLTC